MAYVDREKTLKEIEKKFNPLSTTYCYGHAFHTLVKAIINEQPTADVEEVVRCKDCEHWIYWSDEKRGSCKLNHMSTNGDDFCSCGKRRAK